MKHNRLLIFVLSLIWAIGWVPVIAQVFQAEIPLLIILVVLYVIGVCATMLFTLFLLVMSAEILEYTIPEAILVCAVSGLAWPLFWLSAAINRLNNGSL